MAEDIDDINHPQVRASMTEVKTSILRSIQVINELLPKLGPQDQALRDRLEEIKAWMFDSMSALNREFIGEIKS